MDEIHAQNAIAVVGWSGEVVPQSLSWHAAARTRGLACAASRLWRLLGADLQLVERVLVRRDHWS
jgi:hypothetical protein